MKRGSVGEREMGRKPLAERLAGPEGDELKKSRERGVQVKNRDKPRKFPERWSAEEHEQFVEGVRQLGKGEYRQIAAQFVKTRTYQQVRDHAKHHFKRKGQSASGPKYEKFKWKPEEHKMFLEGVQELGKGKWTQISTDYVKTKTPQQVTSHAVKYYKVRLAPVQLCSVVFYKADPSAPGPKKTKLTRNTQKRKEPFSDREARKKELEARKRELDIKNARDVAESLVSMR